MLLQEYVTGQIRGNGAPGTQGLKNSEDTSQNSDYNLFTLSRCRCSLTARPPESRKLSESQVRRNSRPKPRGGMET